MLFFRYLCLCLCHCLCRARQVTASATLVTRDIRDIRSLFLTLSPLPFCGCRVHVLVLCPVHDHPVAAIDPQRAVCDRGLLEFRDVLLLHAPPASCDAGSDSLAPAIDAVALHRAQQTGPATRGRAAQCVQPTGVFPSHIEPDPASRHYGIERLNCGRVRAMIRRSCMSQSPERFDTRIRRVTLLAGDDRMMPHGV